MLELVDEIVDTPVDIERVHNLLARLIVRYYQGNRGAFPNAQ